MKKRIVIRMAALLLCISLAAAVLIMPGYAGGGVELPILPIDPPVQRRYADVDESHWAYGDIEWVSEHGLMNGTGARIFDPGLSLTRAMFVTVLYRLVSQFSFPTTLDGTISFTDVPKDGNLWYTDAVLWAAERGITDGVGAGLFAPNAKITREQMGTILWRAVEVFMQLNTEGIESRISYADTASISMWAREPMRQIARVGLMEGDNARHFNPQQNATRAEAAAVFRRLFEFVTDCTDPRPADSIVVMSYNIQDRASTTGYRDFCKAIKADSPDVFGAQEVNESWMNLLGAYFKSSYDHVGVGRDYTPQDGSYGEAVPIFYKRDMFTLCDSGTLWLSDTPEVRSWYPETEYLRIMTYALLERKSDGFRFLYVNTHLDVRSAAAIKQFRCLDRLVRGFGYDVPVMVTGDFNLVLTNGGAYAEEIGSLGYTNASAMARFTSHEATWGSSVLDYCFFSPAENFRVLRYEVRSENNNSDHHPILVTFVPQTAH